MSATTIALISFIAIFGGAMVGVLAARILPSQHLNDDTRSTITASTAVVGTMSALVMGLLISNASASFSLQSQEIRQIAVDILQLNRLLVRYGEDAADARKLLQTYAEATVQQLTAGVPITPETRAETIRRVEELQDRIISLQLPDPRHRWLQSETMQLTDSITSVRWLLSEQESRTIPAPFMVLVIFWLAVVFSSFGLFAPRNTMAIFALMFCSMAVSSALLMILEMDTPFTGVMHLSLDPIVAALRQVQI
jgi:hypothetical protein